MYPGSLARKLTLTKKKVGESKEDTCILDPELSIFVRASEHASLDRTRERHPSKDAGFQLLLEAKKPVFHCRFGVNWDVCLLDGKILGPG